VIRCARVWRARRTPRGRIQAVIDANLAPAEFDQRTGTAWLAFWGQVVHAPRLKRVQRVYQRRTLSNLQHALKRLLPAGRGAQPRLHDRCDDRWGVVARGAVRMD
jgi:betaine-aldehyde dehydrogenase